ncbi:DNA/RNA nuclease SfsA [Anaerosporobacter faecicola]|uniref:DNA/RNA nuclease SfsA n=1 Tax=Anaerosporobacter faecicola TaxID=2718714 RepID=UPI00143A0AA0|nr:DNA/RNA nuclease SfsA [Anaerosporobacter faecicola]
MKYERIYEGRFVSRPNRFIAHIEINGTIETCHVKNTGRCKELLLPGATVYVQHWDLPNRKTNWDLIAVKKGDVIINMDSQAPNKVVGEWLQAGGLGFQPDLIKPEYQYEDSRFDFYMEYHKERWLIEVKGVTLEEDHVALFPDAPTLRGIKHVEGLARHAKEGFHTLLFFVIQMDGITYFTPNSKTQPAFATALIEAKKSGVTILAYDCTVTPDQLLVRNPIPIKL